MYYLVNQIKYGTLENASVYVDLKNALLDVSGIRDSVNVFVENIRYANLDGYGLGKLGK